MQEIAGPILWLSVPLHDSGKAFSDFSLALEDKGWLLRYSRQLPTIAVDLSPIMCRLVREKARRAGEVLRVLCADMRSFRLPERVDLITCEGDAINHVELRNCLSHRSFLSVESRRKSLIEPL
jgi:hypothetical protein